MSPVVNVNQEARDMARDAMAKISKHEGECALRWHSTMATMTEIKKGMDGLYTRFWVAAISTIGMLTTACGTLIYMVITKPH